eukprot:m.64674 g.64674  ORF g.64674 m.64674 type:complete len:53 (+) comp35269_c0_seq8:185-343(+)
MTSLRVLMTPHTVFQSRLYENIQHDAVYGAKTSILVQTTKKARISFTKTLDP